jgi:hypothetical protein
MISAQQYQEYMRQGYSEDEINQAIQDQELQNSYNQTQEQSERRTTNTMPYLIPSNSMEWQVELNSTIEEIEHLLRGDVAVTDERQNIVWQHEEKNEILNDKGVRDIIRIIKGYVNRNKIFSDYDDPTICDKVFDFGRRLNDLFFLKYDEWGMDTEEKRKMTDMLVNQIVDMIHDTYLRARHGKERDTLRKIYTINEQLNSGQGFMNEMQTGLKERSIFNPMRWVPGIGGRYAKQ